MKPFFFSSQKQLDHFFVHLIRNSMDILRFYENNELFPSTYHNLTTISHLSSLFPSIFFFHFFFPLFNNINNIPFFFCLLPKPSQITLPSFIQHIPTQIHTTTHEPNNNPTNNQPLNCNFCPIFNYVSFPLSVHFLTFFFPNSSSLHQISPSS